MKVKIHETIIVICLLGVVIGVSIPIVQSIIFKAQTDSIENNARSMGVNAQLLYAEANIDGDVELPFEIKFNEKGYKTYSKNIEIKLQNKMSARERIPKSGEINIKATGEVEIKNLKYGKYTCSQFSNGEIKCQRNS